ncbi:MAG: DNA-binding protein HU [Planctomycetes bacterium]|nr:DNA-binding protein HU [Planctomycetota bacterium]
MNRAMLNEAVAKALGDSKAGGDRAVGAVLDAIAKGLKKNGEVSLVGFGTFKVKTRKARMGRNPKTGEQIKIKASKGVGFKAGKPLKQSV